MSRESAHMSRSRGSKLVNEYDKMIPAGFRLKLKDWVTDKQSRSNNEKHHYNKKQQGVGKWIVRSIVMANLHKTTG